MQRRLWTRPSRHCRRYCSHPSNIRQSCGSRDGQKQTEEDQPVPQPWPHLESQVLGWFWYQITWPIFPVDIKCYIWASCSPCLSFYKETEVCKVKWFFSRSHDSGLVPGLEPRYTKPVSRGCLGYQVKAHRFLIVMEIYCKMTWKVERDNTLNLISGTWWPLYECKTNLFLLSPNCCPQQLGRGWS